MGKTLIFSSGNFFLKFELQVGEQVSGRGLAQPV